ncbi:MAG TPA: prenyltransferase/squalene oxidase repeat-containing protein [Micromonosporaceae bacterium]|jgi:hypothetical protein
MVDIDAAIGFVVARGDAVDRARLSFLRTGVVPGDEVFDQIERGQTRSGGWPARPDDQTPSVDATCFRLAELDDLAGLGRPAAVRALQWLAGRQRPDGCWEEDKALADLAPPWATPGDPDARFYLTACAGFWLAVADADAQQADPDSPSPYGIAPDGEGSAFRDPVERASEALHERIDEAGGWPGFLVSGWLAGAVLHRTGRFYEAARIFVVLAERVRTMSAADAAWLVAALRRAGVTADDALLVAARDRLSRTQRPDGSWPSDDDPAFDVHTTLTALRALR